MEATSLKIQMPATFNSINTASKPSSINQATSVSINRVTTGICHVEGCSEPLISNINLRYEGTCLCKKHRNQRYKKTYKKKTKEFVTAYEESEEIFSGSPEPMVGQLLSDMLHQVLAQKRLELMKSPELIQWLQKRQQLVKVSVAEENSTFQLPEIESVEKKPLPTRPKVPRSRHTRSENRRGKEKQKEPTSAEAKQITRISPMSTSSDTSASNLSVGEYSLGTMPGVPAMAFHPFNDTFNISLRNERLEMFNFEKENALTNENTDMLFSDLDKEVLIGLPSTIDSSIYSDIEIKEEEKDIAQTLSPTIHQDAMTIDSCALLLGQPLYLPVNVDHELNQTVFPVDSRSAFLETGAGSSEGLLSIRKGMAADLGMVGQ